VNSLRTVRDVIVLEDYDTPLPKLQINRTFLTRENYMKYALMLSAALLLTTQAQPVLAQGPIDLVKQSIEAIGGASALGGPEDNGAKGRRQALGAGPVQQRERRVSLSRRFDSHHFRRLHEPVACPLRLGPRHEISRVEKVKYSEIRYPTYGAVMTKKARPRRYRASVWRQTSAKALAYHRLAAAGRELPAECDCDRGQKLGNQTLPAVQYTDGPNKFIIIFDRTTHLPAAVRTLDQDNIWGDQNYDAILSDWKTVGASKLHIRAHTSSATWNPAHHLQGRERQCAARG